MQIPETDNKQHESYRLQLPNVMVAKKSQAEGGI